MTTPRARLAERIRRRRPAPYGWVLAAAGVVVVLAAVVWAVPRLLYPPLPASRFAGVAPDRRIELETNRLKLQNDGRTTLLQGLGGLAVLAGAFFTYRQVQTSRRQLDHTIESSREQHELDRQGQITERFTRAIDQLGHTQLDVRLGGIYALARIARDSPADRATIGEVLTAFVRGHAPWPPRLDDQSAASAPVREAPELQVRAPDVQASLTVLGRGGFAESAGAQGDRLDLPAVDLRYARLRSAHLERANLFHANLEWANLIGAHLEWAGLIGAHLEWAGLNGVYLERANLFNAHLKGADLSGAHLEAARLVGANLELARLGGADLRGADLQGAVANSSTVWPAGFDWRAAGVIMVGEDAAESPPQPA
jgi:Pentapeptide repeats (8 copies)